ncbi:hypothetical protein KIH07_01325 [Hydrogenophaga taeniospiralis]|uniref:hypothetical protein n=1 Tax=Hydrogenophaga taeniospiralis TaxID=65656 RepID=UPI001CFAFD07|nr:hypothetical protein [Hydrogenophaga taeniospiralis]MCB4362354.1 hypothetical protein [Hydrogenophaga taeniospiralis]
MREISAWPLRVCGAMGLALALAAGPARAQSEASLVLSALPVASVVGVAGSAAAGAVAVSALPVALTVSGAVLVVKTVEVSARGTVIVLERASDGARASVELTGRAASGVAASVGTAVAVSVIGTGVLLSAAGEVLCFIPNEIGRALLHNERITY